MTENKLPAAPPTGFVALETVSYKIELAGGSAEGLTLQKIDYIFDGASMLFPASRPFLLP